MLPGLSSRATKDAGDRPGHCVHILCKDNANERNVSLLTNSRVQLILCKDTDFMFNGNVRARLFSCVGLIWKLFYDI